MMNLILKVIPQKAPIACVLALACFIILEKSLDSSHAFWSLIDNYADGRTDHTLFEGRLNKFNHEQDTNVKRVLFIGGSSARENIDCKLVMDHLSKNDYSCTNVGSVAMGPIEVASQRRKLLATKPDLVIWMVNSKDFFEPYHFRGVALYGNLSLIWYYLTEGQLNNFFLYAPYLAKPLIGGISTTYRHRLDLQILLPQIFRDVLKGSLRRDSAYIYWDIDKIRRTQKRKDDRKIYTPLTREAIRILEGRDQSLKAPYVEVPPRFYYRAMDIFLESLEKRSIPFALIHTPILLEKYKGNVEDFEDLTLHIQNKGIEYVEYKNYPKYPLNHFHDWNHFNWRGRARFSYYLANFIENFFQKMEG